jgi:glutathione peroxidase
MRAMPPLFLAFCVIGALAIAPARAATTMDAGAPAAACPAVLNHEFNSLVTDQPVPLCRYAGKVVLVVNTASHCGYTYQYEGLEKIYNKYKNRGLVIIGFPSNEFGTQEPGSNQQIASFCQENYGVSFPMFEKITTPIAQNALYSDLIAASGQAPKWNFHKYLIDKNGAVVANYSSAVEPQSAELTRAIEAALAAGGGK